MSKESKTSRRFPRETIQMGDKRVPAAKIECNKCQSVAYHADTGLNDDVYFKRKGWTVGNGPAADVCGVCAGRKSKPDLKVVPVVAMEVKDKPREITRDERLIIMDKIRDVHDGDRYGAGWSDKKLADDLGVPRAWVEDIRENVLMFAGGHNAEYEAFMAEMAPIVADAKSLINSARVQLEKVAGLESRIAQLERVGRNVEKELAR
jgi:hypothetical protein